MSSSSHPIIVSTERQLKSNKPSPTAASALDRHLFWLVRTGKITPQGKAVRVNVSGKTPCSQHSTAKE